MPQISVFAPSLANLWEVIESYGIDPEHLFMNEGVDLRPPIDVNMRVPYERVDRIRHRAAEMSGDEAFGLRSAQFMHPSHLGSLGYAWLASRSIRIALQRWQRFIRMVNKQARLHLSERGEVLELDFAVDLPSLNMAVREDLSAATLTAMMRFNLGSQFSPLSLSLKRPRPANPEPWNSLFHCELTYGAAKNIMRIPTEQADGILTSANPHMARLNDDLVIRYLEHQEREDFGSRVRTEIIRLLPSGNLDQTHVADALHVTRRTMRRRLLSEETSFKSLLNDIRKELADRLIVDPHLTLTEISFMLGFAETSSFSRAFKNWNGFPPSNARRSGLRK